MLLEPWILRTGLTLVAINGVNGLLFWVARRRQRRAGVAVEAGRLPRVAPARARTAYRLRGALAHFAAVRPAPPRMLARNHVRRRYPKLAVVIQHAISLTTEESIHIPNRASRVQ